VSFKPVIFREYDIRGVFDKDFDLDFSQSLGSALVSYFRSELGKPNPTITLGIDARHSGPAIAEKVSLGIREAGGRCIFLGLITSPISYFSTFTMPEVDGSVMVTGSHNPPDYNGFKISVGNQTIFGDDLQKLKKYLETLPEKFSVAKIPPQESFDIFPSYIEKHQKEFGQIKNIPIVLDCGNGAAGCVARRLFKSVGLTPKILFEEPDGKFPNHHPDPTVEKNLVDLQREVVKSGSIAGIGFDGDADRIGVVDSQGRMIFGDELMVIISRDILTNMRGAKIIGDVKCSNRLFKDIEKNGGTPIMWKTGHSLIKEKIKIEKAPFGGEMSGHIFFNDRNFGYDDALYAALRLIEILAKTGKSITELLDGLPQSYCTPELRFDTTEEKKLAAVSKLVSHFKNQNELTVNLLDGIRISFPDGWALVRSSNTQPVIVMRFEANSAESLKVIRSKIEPIIKDYL
jgi:phosphomannomutase